jgi:hypothetical protein
MKENKKFSERGFAGGLTVGVNQRLQESCNIFAWIRLVIISFGFMGYIDVDLCGGRI